MKCVGRVKEQLKRIGGMEFWDTNFSYIDKDTQEEFYVGLPEEKGSHLIENTPTVPRGFAIPVQVTGRILRWQELKL